MAKFYRLLFIDHLAVNAHFFSHFGRYEEMRYSYSAVDSKLLLFGVHLRNEIDCSMQIGFDANMTDSSAKYRLASRDFPPEPCEMEKFKMDCKFPQHDTICHADFIFLGNVQLAKKMRGRNMLFHAGRGKRVGEISPCMLLYCMTLCKICVYSMTSLSYGKNDRSEHHI